MINIKKNQAGQSLMEMLIAIFILIVALTATIVLVVNSIQAGRNSINKLTATNLAREGIETARNIRDSNWVDPTGLVNWDDGLDVGPTILTLSPDSSVDPAHLTYDVNAFDDAAAKIYYSKSNEYYYQNVISLPGDALDTNFYRVIYISNICQNESGTEEIVNIGSLDDCDVFGTPVTDVYSKVGVKVVAEVRWPHKDSSSKVQIEERLYNWQNL